MQKLLNRGLNFCVLPKKLDLTQVLVDFKRFERSALWREFWFQSEQVTAEPQIFKTKKNNLPKNHTTPEGLKIFLNSVRSEILDPKNRNEAQSNLPPVEMEALLTLIKWQRERKIVIKACDKGAGIIILNFNDYVKACYEHLTSEQTTGKPYYTLVNEAAIEKARIKINEVIMEGLEN